MLNGRSTPQATANTMNTVRRRAQPVNDSHSRHGSQRQRTYTQLVEFINAPDEANGSGVFCCCCIRKGADETKDSRKLGSVLIEVPSCEWEACRHMASETRETIKHDK